MIPYSMSDVINLYFTREEREERSFLAAEKNIAEETDH